MNDAALIEALTDIQVEIQAIHIALEQQGIPAETIEALKSEGCCPEETCRAAILFWFASVMMSLNQPIRSHSCIMI